MDNLEASRKVKTYENGRSSSGIITKSNLGSFFADRASLRVEWDPTHLSLRAL
jgi:hypothetical protein